MRRSRAMRARAALRSRAARADGIVLVVGLVALTLGPLAAVPVSFGLDGHPVGLAGLFVGIAGAAACLAVAVAALATVLEHGRAGRRRGRAP